MGYEHLMRQRVLYDDWTDIVPDAKQFRVVLTSMGPMSCKPAPTSSVAGCVKQKLDDDAELDTALLTQGEIANTQVVRLGTTQQQLRSARQCWFVKYCCFWALEVRTELLLDSTAARGICRREGCRGHTTLVNDTSLATAVGEARSSHLWSMHIAEDRADLGTKSLPVQRLG